MPVNPRDYLILFTLTDGPRHGYGLLKDIARLTGEEVTFDPANLYRSLKRMIKDGMVAEVDTPPDIDGDGERRRYYAITEEGTRLVRSEAARLDRLTAAARERKLIPDAEKLA
jgi:DNA-binding PadR family transcriptional regulator